MIYSNPDNINDNSDDCKSDDHGDHVDDDDDDDGCSWLLGFFVSLTILV